MTPPTLTARAAAVRPSARQLAWQETEFNAFVHYTVNAFTDKEWGDGTESPALFQPARLDAGQWVQAAKDAGMRILILTAKHHDGFCLWPSRHTGHSVINSPWRRGKGDLVKEVADACRQAGLRFGLYCSPWDRHEPTYGTPAYNDHFCNQLRELLTQYGELAEVWFDGACGEGPNGKRQVYDWRRFFATVRELQPTAAIGPCGPDVRWCGNESGFARDSEWSVVGVDFDLLAPATDDYVSFHRAFLLEDHKAGHPGTPAHLEKSRHLVWWPSEVDVSIRPGWFYHASEDLRVHALDRLVDMYYQSVGRNSVLLLNIPPDRRGRFHEHDVARLREFRKTLDRTFAANLALGKPARATSERAPAFAAGNAVDGRADTLWAAVDGATTAAVEIDLGAPTRFNRLLLQEDIREGQRLAAYALEAWHGGAWKDVVRGGCVGHKKLDRFGDVTAARVRVSIRDARAAPTLKTLGLYRAAPGG